MSETASLDVCGIWASKSQRTGSHQSLSDGPGKASVAPTQAHLFINSAFTQSCVFGAKIKAAVAQKCLPPSRMTW